MADGPSRALLLAIVAVSAGLATGCSHTGPTPPAETVTVQQTVRGVSSVPPDQEDGSSTPGPSDEGLVSPGVPPGTATGPDVGMRGPHDTGTPQVIRTVTAPPVPRGRNGTPRGGIPAARSIVQSSPAAVATAALRIMYTQDAALDRTTLDALRRASFLFTADFARGISSAANDSDADFSELAAHRGYTVATVRLGQDGGSPKLTPTAALYEFTITIQSRGDGGWHAPDRQETAVVGMQRAGTTAPWRVADIDFR